MADNNSLIGGRFKLVDPNNFKNQSATGLFGDPNYNISVPNEDLSIMVELVTQVKNRTLLRTGQGTNTAISTDNKKINISFIDGTTSNSTGGQNFLTTSYTDMFNEMKDVEEAFGITSIDIDFNSSYAPMVNINFVDIKGAGLFQMGAKSKYSVLFRLPYPVFELTIKGFYGKPVKYCLNMLKCNTKFNSSNGNFEIAAQFVGYSYAMLSDMLVGYMKAAALTSEGEDLLKARNMISIKEFMRLIGNINGDLPKEVLTDSDEDVHNLSTIEDVKKDLDDMKSLIYELVNTINLNTGADGAQVVEVPSVNENGASLNQTISIVIDPKPTSPTFDDTSDKGLKDNYNTKILEKVKAYNTKVEAIQEFAIPNSGQGMKCNDVITRYVDINGQVDDLKNKIKSSYTVKDDEYLTNILNRFKLAAENAKTQTSNIKFYDVTNAWLLLNDLDKNVKIKQDELTKKVGEKLKTFITNKLGFDTSIRSIINLFTVHIEIFLEQLFNVSNQYDKDTARAEELKIFQNADGAKKIDVNEKDAVKGIIYPWPEYQEGGVEKYLGSKLGPLKNPLNVPEIKFTEELYEAMKKQQAAEDEMNKLEAQGAAPGWLSLNPIDSWIFNQENTNPYGRLPDSSNHDDYARLALLRAVGFMGFSNQYLSDDEIKTFAEQESNLLISKLKSNPDNKILKAYNEKYISGETYTKIGGKITDNDGLIDRLILKDASDQTTITSIGSTGGANVSTNIGSSKLTYQYIKPLYASSINGGGKRLVLPVTSGFVNANYLEGEEFNHGLTLSNVVRDGYFNETKKYDKIRYISFLTKEEYEGGTGVVLPKTFENVPFSLLGLAKETKEIYSYEDLKPAGFIANNGKYGVQEFSLINYDLTTKIENAPFFTMFYNDGDLSNPDGYFPYYTSPTLCRARASTATTVFDIKDTIELPVINDTSNFYGSGYFRLNDVFLNRKDIYKNRLLLTDYYKAQDSVKCPFLYFGTYYSSFNGANGKFLNISLFGSRFYNAQTLEGKAFLFLHCFPWKGLVGLDQQQPGTFSYKYPEILNTFLFRSGFVQVPKYYPAFLGGLLKRARTNGEFLKFEVKMANGSTESLLGKKVGTKYPKNNQYLYPEKSTYGSDYRGPSLVIDGEGQFIEDVLLYLPSSAKEVLIGEFEKFKTEFDTLRKDFEILPLGSTTEGDDASWVTAWNNIQTKTDTSKADESKAAKGTIKLSDVESYLKLKNGSTFKETYNVFSYYPPIPNYNVNYNYFIEFKDDTAAEKGLRNAIVNYKYWSNESVLMWDNRYANAGATYRNYKPIDITYTNINNYFSSFKQAVSDTVSEIQETKKFLTTDQEEIKLEIYRNLKKTYDKWIAFSGTKDKIIFQCCARGKDTPERLTTDSELQKHRGGSQLDLIDSFRFVDSFFRDIGDKFNINPFSINEMLHDSTNVNFYSFLSRILTDNNFDFVALPSFVNYNDPVEVENIFKPYSYYEAKNEAAPSGPSFVCVYVGQTSTKLDFGEDQSSQYPNDGFDFTNNCLNCPEGVKGDSNGKNAWEDIAAAFVVRYGQQNQNFFRDISLDQAEFGATAESLEITDALSNTLSDSNKSFYGQNLYDVYSVRSYKVEVEMMGDAMIQPMMYFQLENMPMFHGAYLITHVKHTIKPHFMSTVFNGTRIKGTQTPLIDAAALYGALLGTFTLPTSSGVITNGTGGGTGINYGKIPLPPEKIGNVVVNYTKSSPFAPGKGAYKEGNPEYIVLHWTAGVKYVGPEHDGLGYHFQITETGEIIQTADLAQRTSHAGCWKENKQGVLVNKEEPCAELNARSIGISYVGGIEKDKTGHDGYVRTEADWNNTNLSLGNGSFNAKAQWEGIVNAILLAKIAHPTIHSVTSHHLTAGDKIDIGDGFPWNKLLDDIYAKTSAAGTPWRPLFADKWYDDSGSGQGRLVHKFGGAIKKENLLSSLTQPEIESAQPRTVKISKDALKLETIYTYLNTGLNNKNLVVGIMANMSVESTFLPTAAGDIKQTIPWNGHTPLKNSSGTIACSWGLTQVNVCGGAGEDYLKWANKTNASNDEKIAILTNANKHMDYVIKKAKELFPDYATLKTPETWAYEWATKYENCRDCGNPNSVTIKERIGIAASLKTQSFYK
jgi:N-acetyl-anhydromuramyl-L-alanine amidase AmpD